MSNLPPFFLQQTLNSVDEAAGLDRVRVVVDRGTTKLMVREDASDVYTFGEGKNGKLGHGDDHDEFTPRIVEALLGRDVIALACGSGHTIAITGAEGAQAVFIYFCFLN